MDTQWIKDLVSAEREREEAGIVALSPESEAERIMEFETHEFLIDIKTVFLRAAASFNEIKDSSLGALKVYGIAKTKADFMLFRNGYKLIFSFKQPGQVSISFQHITATFRAPHEDRDEATPSTNETILVAQWGAFGALKWSYQGHAVKIDPLVRYYLSQFIKESGQ